MRIYVHTYVYMYVQAGERRAHGNIHKENIKNELPALADANKRTLP